MRAMKLNIPIEIVFDDVNSVIDELGKLQKYKLGAGDDMTLVDVDDVADVLTRHVMAREAKEPCGTKEGWIPCSERLPEKCKGNEDTEYLVTIDNGEFKYVTSEFWIYWHGNWEWNRDGVIAWMPLPKEYGGEIDES